MERKIQEAQAIMDSNNPSVVIGIPLSWTHLSYNFMLSLLNLEKPPHTAVIRVSDYSVAGMRNFMCRWCLNRDFTHLFMLDADMVLPKYALQELLKMGTFIASGIAASRFPPHLPNIFEWDKNGNLVTHRPTKEKIIQVAGVGASGLLIHRKVLEVVPEPWFVHNARLPNGSFVSEDLYFCVKAKKYGFPTMVNTEVVYKHEISASVAPSISDEGGEFKWSYICHEEGIPNEL